MNFIIILQCNEEALDLDKQISQAVIRRLPRYYRYL
ncbi:MAG: hypothetical protein J6H22_05685, partial [Pseudobutyrivibrio sp.]|nr:hypothetical protein [Pseudobutyrivibrio sp.]